MLILVAGCWLLNFNDSLKLWEFYLTSIIAKIASHILSFIGVSAQYHKNSIIGKSFSVDIGSGCIAFYEVVVFAAAIIAYPSKIKDKIGGVIAGSIAILTTNLIRVIILFLSGIYFPSIFNILHDHVAQALFILFMVVLWITWVGKTNARISTY